MTKRNECLPGIRRPSRLGAVWLSYRTRWMYMATAVALNLFFAFLLYSNQSIKGEIFPPVIPEMPTFEPKFNFEPDKSNDRTDWSRVRTLSINDPDDCKELWTRGTIPQLTSLRILGFAKDYHIAKLCELYDLKGLSLQNSQSLSPDALKFLSKEASLEFLEIGMTARIFDTPCQLHDVAEFNWPLNLKTLIYRDLEGIVTRRFDEWQKLSQLNCLSLGFVKTDDVLSAEAIETIKRFPKLKQLFLEELVPNQKNQFAEMFTRGGGRRFSDYATKLQLQLPRIAVRPTTYDPQRAKSAGMIVFASTIFTVLLSFQISSQFGTTLRGMTPYFTRSHLIPAVGIQICIVVVSFALLLQSGCSVLASFGLCGCSLLLQASMIEVLSGFRNSHVNRFNPMAILSFFGLVPWIPLLLTNFYRAEVDWMLAGSQSWLHVALFTGSIWSGVHILVEKVRLYRNLEESGLGKMPLTIFDTRSATELFNTSKARRSDEKANSVYRRFDARMERFIEDLAMKKPISSVRLWGLGSQLRIIDYFPVFLVMALVFAGSPLLLPIVSQRGNPGTVIMLLMPLIWAISFGWARRRFQAFEFLRPLSRHDWVSVWFRWVAWELVVALIGIISIDFGLYQIGVLGGLSIGQISLILLSLIGIGALVFPHGMFIITLKSRFLVMSLAGIGWFLASFCMVPALYIQFDPSGTTPLTDILIGFLVVFGIAIAGTFLTWRRWLNWEVGQIS